MNQVFWVDTTANVVRQSSSVCFQLAYEENEGRSEAGRNNWPDPLN